MKKEMKTGIILGILLALTLALIPCLPVVAQETGTITITMTGVNEISITVSPTSWSPGEGGTVIPDTPYLTDTTCFTLIVGGNCAVNTFIAGEDAMCAEDSTYKWALSSDEENAKGVYVLWFKLYEVYGDERRDVLIPKASDESLGEVFYPTSLGPGDSKQFGLKLLTPEPDFTKDGVGYFSVGDTTMETHITISAVAA
jgi:hypothetical protein